MTLTTLAHLAEHELPHLPPSAKAAAVGVCDGNDARRLFYDCVQNVIVPGLDKRGLRGSDAWRAAQIITARTLH